jgi:two-component system chemotaxis response regulator CheB
VRALESDLAAAGLALQSNDRPGRPSVFTCPECHDTLWEAEEKDILRFCCRVGHAYSSDSMLAAQTDSVDRALWAALRALEERAALNRKMSDPRGQASAYVGRASVRDRARIATEHAAVVRGLRQNRTAAQIVQDHADAPELVSLEMMPKQPHPEAFDRELSSTPQDA